MILIREANTNDLDAIVNVHIKSWQQSYQGILPKEYLDNISLKERTNLWGELLSKSSNDSEHFVVLVDKQLVGFCSVGKCRTTSDVIVGEVFAIYILDKYKRKGIGSLLFNRAKKFLFENNLVPYVIWVLQDNIPACEFYKKNGGIAKLSKVDDLGGNSYHELGFIFTGYNSYWKPGET